MNKGHLTFIHEYYVMIFTGKHAAIGTSGLQQRDARPTMRNFAEIYCGLALIPKLRAQIPRIYITALKVKFQDV
jgi:hypothetical protein